MARALASSGLILRIPMATGGWWFSPSRLRDLLAIIIPMIAVTNRFNRQRPHQTGAGQNESYDWRRAHRREAGSFEASRRLPYHLCLFRTTTVRERGTGNVGKKKFCQSFCVILLLSTARSGDAKGLNKGVPTAEAR